jgi:hypothetical protein
MYSQVTTDSSEVHPIGKLKTYRQTIWMMNATNITPSKPATTFSARRLIQSTAVAMVKGMAFSGPPRTRWLPARRTDRHHARRPCRPDGSAGLCCGPRPSITTSAR